MRALNLIDDDVGPLLDAQNYAEALDVLLAHYRDRVLRLAYSIIGDQSHAEEVAQDVFVRVWRALPAFRHESSVSTWIYAIARNTCLTALKRVSARQTVSLDQPEIRSVAESRTASVPRSDVVSSLTDLVSQLPEKYRQVLTLFYMEEKSYEEVAAMLDLPMGTVKTYLHRAKKELAGALRKAKIEKGVR